VELSGGLRCVTKGFCSLMTDRSMDGQNRAQCYWDQTVVGFTVNIGTTDATGRY
jgi:hypothetical protein